MLQSLLIDATREIIEPKTTYNSCRPLAKRSRVRFAERDSVHEVPKEDNADLWYQEEDYTFFRDDIFKQAKALQNAETRSADPQSWSYTLYRVFVAFKNAETWEEVATVLDASRVSLDENVVGLTEHVLPIINANFQERRKMMLHQLRYLQYYSFGEQVIRRASTRNSRASRLFARFVAIEAAESCY